jgi:hypothetical protein
MSKGGIHFLEKNIPEHSSDFVSHSQEKGKNL